MPDNPNPTKSARQMRGEYLGELARLISEERHARLVAADARAVEALRRRYPKIAVSMAAEPETAA